MAEELIAYTDEQHRELSHMVLDSRKTTASGVGVPSHADVYPGVCRVILSESDSPIYQPKTPRLCALFEFNKDGVQTTIEFAGDSLEGDVVLVIQGVEMHVDCKATTKELRAVISGAGFSLADLRATVFPGLWELDFNGGNLAAANPVVTAHPYEPPQDDTETPVFSGELYVVQEAWLSVSRDGDTVEQIETRDWMPFRNEAIKPGAIGGVVWSHEAGWLALAWQCRELSFATYDPYSGGA